MAKAKRAEAPAGETHAPLMVLRGSVDLQPKRGRGAPVGALRTPFDPDKAAVILWQLSMGASLREICKAPGFPSDDVVRGWAITHDDFHRQYLRAREHQMEAYADQIIEIGDDETLDPNSRRVRIDARKWIASKMAPRRFGDKLIHSGDVDNPVRVLHQAASVDQLSPMEIDALEAFAMARIEATDAQSEDIPDGSAPQD